MNLPALLGNDTQTGQHADRPTDQPNTQIDELGHRQVSLPIICKYLFLV